MMNLKERYPALTGDDVFFCVLSLLCCSKTVVMELMDATSDALKTRKNRIKNKMDAQIFERVFGVDNQGDVIRTFCLFYFLMNVCYHCYHIIIVSFASSVYF